MVFRPADSNEASVAAKLAFQYNDKPSIILLTRQKLPVLDRDVYTHFNEFERGAYIISDYDSDNRKVSIFASGSEVSLALDVKERLKNQFNIRVVNFGCWELFDEQSDEYKANIIHDSSFKISIGGRYNAGWEKYTGNCLSNSMNIGIDRYGESAPSDVVANELGISLDKVVDRIKRTLKTTSS